MIALNGIDYTTNTAVFSISKAADIPSLPTTQKSGTADGNAFPPVKAGSLAYTTDGSLEKYTLDGDSDEWKKVQK